VSDDIRALLKIDAHISTYTYLWYAYTRLSLRLSFSYYGNEELILLFYLWDSSYRLTFRVWSDYIHSIIVLSTHKLSTDKGAICDLKRSSPSLDQSFPLKVLLEMSFNILCARSQIPASGLCPHHDILFKPFVQITALSVCSIKCIIPWYILYHIMTHSRYLLYHTTLMTHFVSYYDTFCIISWYISNMSLQVLMIYFDIKSHSLRPR
jgi:hypothetical protein